MNHLVDIVGFISIFGALLVLSGTWVRNSRLERLGFFSVRLVGLLAHPQVAVSAARYQEDRRLLKISG